MDSFKIFDVTADEATGQWIDYPVDSGETTSRAEWLAKSDTDAQHFDTHIAWERDGEITTTAPSYWSDWSEITIAIRVTWSA